MIYFNVEFTDGAYHLKCGLSMTGLKMYSRIMKVSIDESKEAIIRKGVFNATAHDIWSDNQNAIQELADVLNEAKFVSANGNDMRKWSLKALQNIDRENFNWMEGYPSAPFDRFIIETIKMFQPDLYLLITKTAISNGTISELVEKHLH